MTNNKTDKINTCDFCGHTYSEKEKTENKLMIFSNGKTINICSNCIKRCEKVYDDYIEANKNKNKNKDIVYTPDKIKEHLDEWIINQDEAKKIIATEVYNHLKRIKRIEENPEANKKLKIDKSNIIMVGKTGTGKTHIIQALGEILDLPYVIENANVYTASGYVGGDVEDIIKDLMDKANNDIERAQKGIVFIDEFDKLKKEFTMNGTKDVGGEAVQQALLKMIEGCEYNIKKNKVDNSTYKFDTTNVLFILGGAFEGIEDIVQKRIKKESSIGFGSHKESKKKLEYNQIADKIIQEDLKEFGIISEALGRCPVIAVLNDLEEEDFIHILTEPKHAIVKQFTELLRLDNKDLEVEFTDEALIEIAKTAKQSKIGARGLRSIITKTLAEAMYVIPKDKTIKKLIVNKDLECEYIHNNENNDSVENSAELYIN